MSKLDELAYIDATALAELVRRKEIKPVERVEAAVGRIERLNPELNAVVTPMYDQAIEAAKADLPDGPFMGVPFLLKDLLAVCGRAHDPWLRLMRHFVPDHDSELVNRSSVLD
jgi:amidase